MSNDFEFKVNPTPEPVECFRISAGYQEQTLDKQLEVVNVLKEWCIAEEHRLLKLKSSEDK